jgi:hypothetical protein
MLALHVEAISKFRIKLDQQLEHFEGDLQVNVTLVRNGIFKTQRWTNGKIPYEIKDPGFKAKEYQDILLKAMKEIQDHTCIKFVPRTNEENYITIINGSGCYSSVGMTGGRQTLSLADSGCWYHGTVVHEFLHAVGLWHEQSRFDRDKYIKIVYDNILKGTAYNFDMKFENETSTYGIPYNYMSVMHYSKDAFGKNGSTTIETADPWFSDLIGNRDGGTDGDYAKVRKIYDCAGAFPTRPMPTTTAPPPCQDTYEHCNEYKQECNKPGSFTSYGCRVTCGHCTKDCADKATNCRETFANCKTVASMKQTCAKTCKFCSPY